METSKLSSVRPEAPVPPRRPPGSSRKANTVKHRELIDLFDLHNAPGHLLRRCHSRARAIFDQLIRSRTGLSKQQVALLIAIAHRPSATHAQLSEETGFDRNTLADTLNRLISKGLAVRQHSTQDARAYDIQLTPQGLAELEDLIPLSYEVQAKIIEPIPAEMREGFMHCLRLLAGVEGAAGERADSDEETVVPRRRAPKSRKGVSTQPARS